MLVKIPFNKTEVTVDHQNSTQGFKEEAVPRLVGFNLGL